MVVWTERAMFLPTFTGGDGGGDGGRQDYPIRAESGARCRFL